MAPRSAWRAWLNNCAAPCIVCPVAGPLSGVGGRCAVAAPSLIGRGLADRRCAPRSRGLHVLVAHSMCPHHVVCGIASARVAGWSPRALFLVGARAGCASAASSMTRRCACCARVGRSSEFAARARAWDWHATCCVLVHVCGRGGCSARLAIA